MSMRQRANQRGQALLLVVIVLLALSLLAASVVAVVAGSAKDTDRSEASAHARSLSMAGIRFADEMLTTSPQAADWRPRLDDFLVPGGPVYTAQAYDNTYDSFEKLRGWDPASSGAPYYVKYRFAMDPDGNALDPTVDPGQDFTDPDRLMPNENSEVSAPHDHFLLRLEYAPNPTNPLTKAIKITSVGRPGGESNVFDELVAYKPLGLQDYLLFVHDGTRRAATAPLGVPPLDIDGDGKIDFTVSSNRAVQAGGDWPAATGGNDLVPLRLNGPVRSNEDLAVQLPVRIDTQQPGGGWKERVEVAGTLTAVDQKTGAQFDPLTDANPSAATDGNDQLLVTTTAGGVADVALPAKAAKPAVQVATGSSRVEAPALETREPVTGVSRWERLTRYSGDAITVARGSASVQENSGEVGYGRGIYLDNGQQRDNLDLVRNTWLAPETWGGRRYVPKGALVELYETFTFPGGATGPAIVITRTDGSSWVNVTDGQPSGSPTLAFAWPDKDGVWNKGAWTAGSAVPTAPPTPDNGVILAEGNLRIRGRLPVCTAGHDYHLTVVSRGSIYVEGPLLRPSDYGAAAVAAPENSRIALLAHDHMVLNPTALAPGQAPGLTPAPFDTPASNPTDSNFQLDAAGTQTIGIEVPSDGTNTNRSVLAAVADGDASDARPARASVLFANNRSQLGAPYGAGGPTLLSPDATARPEIPGAKGVAAATFFADFGNLARAVYVGNTQEYMPDSWPALPGVWAANGRSNWVTVASGIESNGTSGGQSDVVLKNLKVEQTDGAGAVLPGVRMTVSALMFAERGTFFVIPGDWFDARALSLADVKEAGNAGGLTAQERLVRLKRYNYQVVVNGVVAVNNLSELADVASWSDKWAYPTNGSAASLVGDFQSVQYSYDWGLRTTWPAGSPRANLPLLPALPPSPGLLYVGDENKT